MKLAPVAALLCAGVLAAQPHSPSTWSAQSGTLTADTRLAFSNMWALQFRAGDQKGAWAWLQFHNQPWEGDGSAYFGASLAAIAVARAPGGYASSPEIAVPLKSLRDYLGKGADTVSLFNRLMGLWASSTLTDVLTPSQPQSIIA